MSIDQFFGAWEIRWQGKGDKGKLQPGTKLLIGRDGAKSCGIAWLDGDHNLCSFSKVPYDGAINWLQGCAEGCGEEGKKGHYDVKISFLLGSATVINGDIAALVPSSVEESNDDPLTGLWTADRRPGDGQGDPPTPTNPKKG